MTPENKNMQRNEDEKLGLFGLALGFTIAFVLLLTLGLLGILPLFYAMLSSDYLSQYFAAILVFAIIMLVCYKTPRRWFFQGSA